MLLVLAAAAGEARGQTPSTPPTPPTPPSRGTGSAPPAATQPNSLPSVGDLVSAVDKATTPAPGKPGDWSSPVKLAVVFAGLALLPSLLVMTTSFTRIVIVLAFVRRALTTQSIPPTIAIIGLAIFLTLFTMAGTFAAVNEQAVQPYVADRIGFDVAVQRASDLLKEFMLRQTRQGDLGLFMELAGQEKTASPADLPMHVVTPAFAISEFRTGFEMGCLLFIPFLLIDLVVASILLSAGMMMLPPTVISLPLKIILFVLVDGWRLLAQTLVRSFA